MDKTWPSYMNLKCRCCTVPYRLIFLNFKLSSAKLSRFSDIWQAFGAIMYLLVPKGGWRSLGLFSCLILSAHRVRLFFAGSVSCVLQSWVRGGGGRGWICCIRSMIYESKRGKDQIPKRILILWNMIPEALPHLTSDRGDTGKAFAKIHPDEL